MSARALIGLAGAGSAALLLGALAFQHIGGLSPCALCIDQRYPHALAIVIAALGWRWRHALLPILGALSVGTSGAIGLFHTGIERGFWEGPTTCTAAPIGQMSADDLFDQIMAAPLIRCDEVAWSLAGLSMASWNAALSLALACIWLAALRRTI